MALVALMMVNWPAPARVPPKKTKAPAMSRVPPPAPKLSVGLQLLSCPAAFVNRSVPPLKTTEVVWPIPWALPVVLMFGVDRMPPAIETGPVKVLAPLTIQVPVPVFVTPPAPAVRPPAKVLVAVPSSVSVKPPPAPVPVAERMMLPALEMTLAAAPSESTPG